MADTELQIARQRASDLKMRVLKQQTLVLNMKRAGGDELEAEQAALNALRDDLEEAQTRLGRLVQDF